MEVSSSSMKVASVTVRAMTQGFTEGFARDPRVVRGERSETTAVAKDNPGEYD